MGATTKLTKGTRGVIRKDDSENERVEIFINHLKSGGHPKAAPLYWDHRLKRENVKKTTSLKKKMLVERWTFRIDGKRRALFNVTPTLITFVSIATSGSKKRYRGRG